MHFHPFSLIALGFIPHFSSALRGAATKDSDANRFLQGNSPCTISKNAYLQIPGEDPIVGGDEELGCDNGNGQFIPLKLDGSQTESLDALAADGELYYGLSTIDTNGATIDADGNLNIPGNAVTVIDKNPSANTPWGDRKDRRTKVEDRRNLQSGTGIKHFLVFRVTSSDGLVYADSPAVMSDKVFGTTSDTVNLKSQLTACSVGKYTVTPGGKPGYDTTPLESAPGVISISIGITLDNTRNTIRNAAMDEAERVLGEYFGLSPTTSLTRYADHVMFSLHSCKQECGWAAYAGVGSYYQFYQSAYYKYAGVQLHEHGHNMQLAHSGGLDGQTYTDHTCSMGNPLYGDNLGKMCFNEAKNWQMQVNPHPTTVISGWYANEDFVTIDTAQGAQTVKMIGVGEYNLQGDGATSPRKAIALKVENGSTRPQYIAFNSAKGANSQNDEADNLVTITEYTGTGYATSSLKGYIGAGQTFTTAQGRIVEAQCINIAETPSLACVCVRDSTQTCPNDCQCTSEETSPEPTRTPTPPPTNAPVTPAPTNTPTTPFPTSPPTTPFPSVSPTTAPPSKSPTDQPTDAPTQCTLGQPGQKCSDNGGGNAGCCSGLCESSGNPANRVCLGASGPTTPPAPTPELTPAPVGSCLGRNGLCGNDDSLCCSGNCKNNGKCA